MGLKQLTLLDVEEERPDKATSTFVSNMALPVHRWFRYSAGFSAAWAEKVISAAKTQQTTRVLDPFAGSATTLLAAEDCGVESFGVESHPFISRVAQAKLLRHSPSADYRQLANRVLRDAKAAPKSELSEYPDLIRRCYTDESLHNLDRLRRTLESIEDDSPASMLTWLTLVAILRTTSHVGTAQWQYVLPNKSKKNSLEPFEAYARFVQMFSTDMEQSSLPPHAAKLVIGDARECQGVPEGFATLVVTSPPYPNNYDYADATRLEMSFMREIDGWAHLQDRVRQYLVRSCSQHTTQKNVDLKATLEAAELEPIAKELSAVCEQLGEIRLSKGGKKNYHLMIASYFLDLAKVWHSLRRVCDTPCDVCFVVGDSAPYGVYVPVIDWLGRLAVAAGFKDWRFEKVRDRNVKWKNRKHRVPLCEGHLWVRG